MSIDPGCARRGSVVSLLTALVVLAGSATAYGAEPAVPVNPCLAAPATVPFYLNTNRPGVIDLHFYRAQGAPVTYFECIGDEAIRLGKQSSPTNTTSFYDATTWDCTRLTRYFVATATLPDGSLARGAASARTMSCAERFKIVMRRQIDRGRRTRVKIVDSWGIGGVRSRLCVTSPRGRHACRMIVLANGTAVLKRHFRPAARGRWRVELRVAGHRVRDSIAVGIRDVVSKAAPPTVLATGDSTMQGLESFLSDDLAREATVVSDVRPGLALSGSNDWAAIAAEQAVRVKPATTVLSIGANESRPMQAADGATLTCCDEAWAAEYAARMRQTMLTYGRHGRSRVFVLTIAVPHDPKRVPLFAAVNQAIVRAAEGLAGVRVLRMDQLFSPNGYATVMHYDGRDVHIREPDGIHLNVAGLEIAAREVAKAMRER